VYMVSSSLGFLFVCLFICAYNVWVISPPYLQPPPPCPPHSPPTPLSSFEMDLAFILPRLALNHDLPATCLPE
jgi:hypothetical protein